MNARNEARVMIVVGFACIAIWCAALLLLSQLGQCVELSIVGHSAGQGILNLSYAGDFLNVSLSQNGSGWNISLLGGAA
jgi:hypothetical protein